MAKCFYECCSTKLSCVCSVLTIQRHHDTVRQLWRRRTRKEHQACAPRERQRFANCPRWWQPHDNGDIFRSPPTQMFNPACTPRKFQHTRRINRERDGSRSCRVPIAAASQKHKHILTSSHTFISLNSWLAVNECPSKSRHSSAPWSLVG